MKFANITVIIFLPADFSRDGIIDFNDFATFAGQ